MALQTFFYLLLFLLSCGSFPMFSESSDALLLLSKIKPSLQGSSSANNQQLSSWNTSVPLCQWRGLKWSLADGSSLACEVERHKSNLSLANDPSLQLVSLELAASGLAGSIPMEIGELSFLKSLYLGVNSLAGAIPMELGNCPALSEIDLSGNRLNGSVPTSIWNLCGRLTLLNLHGNALAGPLPAPAMPNVTCASLVDLDLGQNRLQGPFPTFVTGFSRLRVLDLSGNHFNGPIPESLSGLANLQSLNLSHNNFSGPLPSFGEHKFSAESFVGNDRSLCGDPLSKCPGSSSSGLSPGAVAALVIGLLSGAVVASSLAIGYYQKRRGTGAKAKELEGVEEEVHEGGREGSLLVFQGGEHLTLDEVLNATGQVLEKTTYGTVYKARLTDGGAISLRLLREGSCKDKASCLPVVKHLARARHDNLVPLRAFYEGERSEKLLIYDYLPNRTLHELLHGSGAGRPQLTWARRHKIALGVARGLAYLHTGTDEPIVHGNVRAKNVLVDEFYVPRLTEYGLDRMMVTAVTEEMVAEVKASGYNAPELQKMKKSSARTDVYAFGILLLELLTGKKPGKDAEGGNSAKSEDLPSLVKAAVLEETTMELFDAELLKNVRSPTEEGMVHALKLAMGCCAPVAEVRPDMPHVVKQLEENRPRNRSGLYTPARSGLFSPAEPRSGLFSPAEPRSEIGTPRGF